MPRSITIAAAQMGPIARTESRAAVARRLIRPDAQIGLPGRAGACVSGSRLDGHSFPHWWIDEKQEINSWVIGMAKDGNEEGVDMIAANCNGDEVIVARCDLDLGLSCRNTTFNFALRRSAARTHLVVDRTGRDAP